jgi:hypothetical protein
MRKKFGKMSPFRWHQTENVTNTDELATVEIGGQIICSAMKRKLHSPV